MSTVVAKNIQVGTSGTATNNFTWYQPASPDGTVRLGVGNSGATSSDAVTVNNSGNVGVGTASPAVRLQVDAGSSSELQRYNTTSTTPFVGWYTSGTRKAYQQWDASFGWILDSEAASTGIVFRTQNTARMQIDSSGNAGIGTSSPSTYANGSSPTLVVGTGNNWIVSQARTDGPSGAANGVRLAGNYSTNPKPGSAIWLGAQGGAGQRGMIGFFTKDTDDNTNEPTERVRVASNGQVGIGGTPDTLLSVFSTTLATNSQMVHVSRPGTADMMILYASDAYGPNGAAGSMKIGSQSATGRSINATGTINASGADYAEYMTKSGDFTVAKGGVVGINAEGKLTNVFADAVAFVVKSTDPSYVGGDRWGSADALGVQEPKALSAEATDEEKTQYEADKAAFEAILETARQKVDRIAFSGQVPVNVTGATPGQYIVPVDDNGGIKGVAKSEADLTLAEYMKAVGKVIAVEADGRARIIVKVA